MGTWGVGVFDNDSAMDWVEELVQEEDLDYVVAALQTAVSFAGNQQASLEEPEAAEALAAAEVIAALSGNASQQLPEDVIEWLNGQQHRIETLMELARKAVEIVRSRSELRDLWEESTEKDAWNAVLDDLMHRLS